MATAAEGDANPTGRDPGRAFREMRRICSDAKIVLCSGYNEQEATSRFTGKGLAGFVQKPFEMSKLIGAVRAALEL